AARPARSARAIGMGGVLPLPTDIVSLAAGIERPSASARREAGRRGTAAVRIDPGHPSVDPWRPWTRGGDPPSARRTPRAAPGLSRR
ncbi:MAG: hypothetical protein ACRENC_04040, partial [Gemmatimonadaceae bacterium]